MKLVVVSFKECWREADGRWYSYGGFPLQMEAVCSMFESAELVLCQGEPRPGGIALPQGAEVVALPLPSGRNFRRKLSVAARLPMYLARIAARVRRADVVHTPVPGDIALLGMLTGLAFRKKLIGRYCGSWDGPNSMTRANRFIRRLMPWAAGGRNVMLVAGLGSEPVAPGVHWVVSTALRRQDLDEIEVDFERPLSDPLELVYAGRLSVEKGVDHLIEMIRLLRQQKPSVPVRLNVLGGGPDAERVERLALEHGLGEQVRFLGQLNRQDLDRRLASADLYVHAALTEAQAKSWLDAMSHGLPVVCYDAGTARAMIGTEGERGVVVECGQPQQLADAVIRLSESPELPAMRRRCRAFAEAHTIEAWRDRIGQLCAESWGGVYSNDRLDGVPSVSPTARTADV